MHTISIYRGNRPTYTPTHKHTHRQHRLQYTVPQLAHSVNMRDATTAVKQQHQNH